MQIMIINPMHIKTPINKIRTKRCSNVQLNVHSYNVLKLIAHLSMSIISALIWRSQYQKREITCTSLIQNLNVNFNIMKKFNNTVNVYQVFIMGASCIIKGHVYCLFLCKQTKVTMRIDGKFNTMFGLPSVYWINIVKTRLISSRKVSYLKEFNFFFIISIYQYM